MAIDWKNVVEQVIAGLVVAAIIGIVGALVSRRFRRVLQRIWEWMRGRWQEVLAVVLLLGATVGVFLLTPAFWAVVLTLLVVGAGFLLRQHSLGPDHILDRRVVEVTEAAPNGRVGQLPDGRTLWTLVSGEVGAFSASREGPWTPSVVCSPVHRRWAAEGRIGTPEPRWVWIRERPTDEEARQGQIVWHRLEFCLPEHAPAIEATLMLMVDDYARVLVNSTQVERSQIAGGIHDTEHGPYLRSEPRISMSEGVAELTIGRYLRCGHNLVGPYARSERQES